MQDGNGDGAGIVGNTATGKTAGCDVITAERDAVRGEDSFCEWHPATGTGQYSWRRGDPIARFGQQS